jgi:hypothetical protein
MDAHRLQSLSSVQLNSPSAISSIDCPSNSSSTFIARSALTILTEDQLRFPPAQNDAEATTRPSLTADEQRDSRKHTRDRPCLLTIREAKLAQGILDFLRDVDRAGLLIQLYGQSRRRCVNQRLGPLCACIFAPTFDSPYCYWVMCSFTTSLTIASCRPAGYQTDHSGHRPPAAVRGTRHTGSARMTCHFGK